MPVRNIIIVYGDDLRNIRRTRNIFGPALVTPHWDDFCSHATVFDRSYAVVSVCEPSRVGMLTGLSPLATMVLENLRSEWQLFPPQASWLVRLRQAGITVVGAGKEWHGYVPPPEPAKSVCYDQYAPTFSYEPSAPTPKVQNGGRNGAGYTDTSKDTQWYDAQVVLWGIDWLNALPVGAKPFRLALGLKAPHAPFDAPQACFDAYDWTAYTAPAGFLDGFDIAGFSDLHLVGDGFRTVAGQEIGSDYWKKSVRNADAKITHWDREFGRFWTWFKASRFYGDTMVIVLGDHGLHITDAWMQVKHTSYESALSPSFAIYHPDQPARVITQPVSLMDLGYTVLDAFGLPQMDYGTGRSLMPAVTGGTLAPKWIASFLPWGPTAAGRIGGVGYRATMYPNGEVELYAIDTDPYMQTNLGRSHPQWAPARDAMLDACAAFGFKPVEQGVALDTAIGMAGLYGNAAPDVAPAPGSFASLANISAWRDSPNFRRWLVTADGSVPTMIAPDDVDLIHVYVTQDAAPVTIVGGKGDKDLLLYAKDAGGQTVTLKLEGGRNTLKTELVRLNVLGGTGDDSIVADRLADTLLGGEGDDYLDARGGSDSVAGGPGNDTIIGDVGADTILADAGEDVIDAGDDDDLIRVAGGRHRITGGTGGDRFVFSRTEETQVITDLGTTDVIDLSAWAPIGPVTVMAEAGKAVISAGHERIECEGATTTLVRSRIEGVAVLP